MELLRNLFSHICGQQHCWTLGGVTVPFCQRCTGLYAGALCALILIMTFRPRPRASMYWLHGVFMLVMFPFGFHLVEHGGLVRTFTGALFAFGLVYYFALNPISVWSAWRPDRGSDVVKYVSLIAVFIALLLASVQWGGAAIAIALAALGTLGFSTLVILTAANLIVLPGILQTLLHRSAAPTP